MSGAQGPRATRLLARADELATALERGGDRIPEGVHRTVQEAVAAVRGRVARGVDHTIVALVGGTGSGKSSLFNALSGLSLADVGVQRPTTSRVTACVWSRDAGPVLDWLEVPADRRMERESLLDGADQADLHGLVLLDLPDHDSVAPEHRAVVDRLLPMTDLLVWVVDPQKYADDALHTGYLSHLRGREGAMVVVLNQLDTVPSGERAGLLADVSRLLAGDGLDEVPVHGVSAVTGQGVAALRSALAAAVAGRGVAERRGTAELVAAARELELAVGAAEPELEPAEAVARDALAVVVGARARLEHARRGGTTELPGAAGTTRSGGPDDADGGPRAGEVQPVIDGWLAATAGALPAGWRGAVAAALPDAAAFAAAVRRADADVEPPAPPARGRGRDVAALLVTVAVLAGVGAALAASGVLALDLGGASPQGVLGAVSVVAALLAVVTAWLTARARRHAAERAARTWHERLLAALGAVVGSCLSVPTADVLDDHRVVRLAAGPASATPATGSGAGPGAPPDPSPGQAPTGAPAHAASTG